MKRLFVSSLAGLGLLAASAALAQEKTQEQAAEQEAAGQQAKQQQQAEQQQRPTKQEMEEAGKAADTMVLRAYVYDPIVPKTPEEIVVRLLSLGYTNIHDFDVEWRVYEVEATTPAGEDVEIEIDPITGSILDIDEDFF